MPTATPLPAATAMGDVALSVSDLSRSVAFWRDAVGLATVREKLIDYTEPSSSFQQRPILHQQIATLRKTLADLVVGRAVEPVFDHGADGMTLLRFRPAG